MHSYPASEGILKAGITGVGQYVWLALKKKKIRNAVPTTTQLLDLNVISF